MRGLGDFLFSFVVGWFCALNRPERRWGWTLRRKVGSGDILGLTGRGFGIRAQFEGSIESNQWTRDVCTSRK